MEETIRKRVLYPKNDASRTGELVAMGYLNEKSVRPTYTVRSFYKYYYVHVLYKETIVISCDDTTLRRLKKKINKKEKQGYLTYEQGVKIILTTVCNMVEEQLKETFL